MFVRVIEDFEGKKLRIVELNNLHTSNKQY